LIGNVVSEFRKVIEMTGNCAKGGVFTQAYGWEGTEKLYTGIIFPVQY